MPFDASLHLGELIATAARDHARTSPPPRGLPFFGLDHRSGSAVELLGALASHGIFRKYELVLDLSAHLGMSSRWLATMLGCTAVATTASLGEAAAANALTRAAGLADQVHHVAADPAALPFTDAGFTHVWSVEALALLGQPAASLHEAFRVLRPGGYLAVQELVCGATDAPTIPGISFAATDTWLATLGRAGFVDVSARDVNARARESAALLTTARARLGETLEIRGRADPALDASGRQRALLAAALAAGTLTVVQIVARRP